MANYFSKQYSQTSLRKAPKEDAEERGKRLDVVLPHYDQETAGTQYLIAAACTDLNDSIVAVILPDFFSDSPSYLAAIFKSLKIKAPKTPPPTSATDKKHFAKIWDALKPEVLARIKFGLMQHHIEAILLRFEAKIEQIARSYIRHLPRHVAEGEGDDLMTIAQLEFVETFKVWHPEKAKDIWPLAYTRITGAMKDHIRYITRSDPSRLYDWVNDAGYILRLNQEEHHFEERIETGIQLNRALGALSVREKRIVVAYAKKDETFLTISEKMKLSESQVSRIYKKAIEKMRKELRIDKP